MSNRRRVRERTRYCRPSVLAPPVISFTTGFTDSMTKHLGIDIRSTHIRVAELDVSYRRTAIHTLYEVDRSHFPTLVEALKNCAGPLLEEAETIATAVAGEQAFFHRIELPLTAQRQ